MVLEGGQTCITNLRLHCCYTECLLHRNAAMYVCLVKPFQYLDFPLHLLSVITCAETVETRNEVKPKASVYLAADMLHGNSAVAARTLQFCRRRRCKDDDKGAFEKFRAKKTYLISTCVILNLRNRFRLCLFINS